MSLFDNKLSLKLSVNLINCVIMNENQSLKEAIANLKLPAVVAFGNPLLDVVSTIQDDNLLEKYKLKVDSELELPEEIIQQILADLPTE